MLLAALTAAVAFDAPGLAPLEHAVGAAVLHLTREHPALRGFWSADASWQQPDVFRVFLLAGVVGLLLARQWWYAGWLASVLVLSTALAGFVKEPLARARPTWAHPVSVVSGLAYPSGHATAGWVFATAAVLLTMRFVPSLWPRVALITLAVSAAVVVSLDRVFLGVHYPSDVLAGGLLGCLLAVLPWLALSRVTRPPGPGRRV